jgi:tetratricopeptide (TPR) repeat protein
LRVDIFGIREGGGIDGHLFAPLRPEVPKLKPGGRYLIEVVLRTLKLGHPFTQGTADSNEAWLDMKARSGQNVVGRSGALGQSREVDPWAHFLNIYMLDREGRRIDRRNPQDIFTPLYDHQIPPGAAQVAHYELVVPENQREPLTLEAKLQYRKFDTIYLNYILAKDYTNGAPFNITNDLPITTIASDTIAFPIDALSSASLSTIGHQRSTIPEWQRWNDYGIGLLLEGNRGAEKGELIQAEQAFAQVEKLGFVDGPLNLARVYLKEGRLDEAVTTLKRAANCDPPAPRWTVAWLNGLVDKQNGFLDQAIADFRSILEDHYPELDQRSFDFSKDYEVINELGQTLLERAKGERANPARQKEFLEQALAQFQKTLTLDSENLTAHYNLALIYSQLGDEAKAANHRQQHDKFRPDDNAKDRAISIARRANAAADHAAQATVIYNLHRPGAPGLQPAGEQGSMPATPKAGGL